MSTDLAENESAKKCRDFGWGFFFTLGSIALLGWLFASSASFTIGHTHSRFLIQTVSNASRASKVDPKAILIHSDWRDPEGEITRGQAYGLRIGSSVFEFDMYYAPRGFVGKLENF